MTIISDQFGFVFLKTRKTGGSSVEHWLLPQLPESDYAATSIENKPVRLRFWNTPDPTVGILRFANFVKPITRALFPSQNFGIFLTQHMTANEIISLMGKEKFDGFFSFCVERHPYERLVSLWRWRCHLHKIEVSFDEFIELCFSDPRNKLVRNYGNSYIYTVNNKISVDKIIKYPNFHKEIFDLAKQFGMDPQHQNFPRFKANPTGVSTDLNLAQKKKIYELVGHEIDIYESL